jgi:hypothetical protein
MTGGWEILFIEKYQMPKQKQSSFFFFIIIFFKKSLFYKKEKLSVIQERHTNRMGGVEAAAAT